MSRRGRSIALVGLGPKGLYCLERLAIELSLQRSPEPITVRVFEPHDFPGAGPVWDPRQPSYLRMNFANRHVDAWSRCAKARQAFQGLYRPTLVEWLGDRRADFAGANEHAPRASVGAYLHDVYRVLRRFLAGYVDYGRHASRVDGLHRSRDHWRLEAAGTVFHFDEVLLATGHDSRQAAPCVLLQDPRCIPSVYPVKGPGRLDHVPAGSTVAIRGFALTAIDAALALTEGRGGIFRTNGRPGQLEYRSGEEQAPCLIPYSRSGRPMLPKPAVPLIDAPLADELWQTGADSIAAIERFRTPDQAFAALRAELCSVATRVLRASTGHPIHNGHSAEAAERYLDLLDEKPAGLRGEWLLRRMALDLEIAYGRRALTLDWAFGAAWRGLYPAIVKLVGSRHLDHQGWLDFSKLARQMERLAFGPPADNMARFVALGRAGVVDLSFVAAPQVVATNESLELRKRGKRRRVDRLVNAVLAPPGAFPNPSPLLRQLVEHGWATPSAFAPGIEVDDDGTCTGPGGRATPGLAVVGRPTEGRVLGNDTLSRSLHRLPERWALRVAARSGQRAVEVRAR